MVRGRVARWLTIRKVRVQGQTERHWGQTRHRCVGLCALHFCYSAGYRKRREPRVQEERSPQQLHDIPPSFSSSVSALQSVDLQRGGVRKTAFSRRYRILKWQPYWRTGRPFCLLSQAPDRVSIHVTLLSSTRGVFIRALPLCLARRYIAHVRIFITSAICALWIHSLID